jgi:F0F1-type ATP synthase membrane subunit b/b'
MENRRESIESELADALELGLDAEEALAEAAGLLSEAEARFVRLSHPAPSVPPPRW